jgi:hypothetical protein
MPPEFSEPPRPHLPTADPAYHLLRHEQHSACPPHPRHTPPASISVGLALSRAATGVGDRAAGNSHHSRAAALALLALVGGGRPIHYLCSLGRVSVLLLGGAAVSASRPRRRRNHVAAPSADGPNCTGWACRSAHGVVRVVSGGTDVGKSSFYAVRPAVRRPREPQPARVSPLPRTPISARSGWATCLARSLASCHARLRGFAAHHVSSGRLTARRPLFRRAVAQAPPLTGVAES